MEWTGLDVFDQAITRTNAWLKEFMQELNSTDRRGSFDNLVHVLHAIRNHLEPDAAVRFGNQLPLLIRGSFFEDWQPGAASLSETPYDPTAVRAVFRLLRRKADLGEIESVEGILPQDL